MSKTKTKAKKLYYFLIRKTKFHVRVKLIYGVPSSRGGLSICTLLRYLSCKDGSTLPASQRKYEQVRTYVGCSMRHVPAKKYNALFAHMIAIAFAQETFLKTKFSGKVVETQMLA